MMSLLCWRAAAVAVFCLITPLLPAQNRKGSAAELGSEGHMPRSLCLEQIATGTLSHASPALHGPDVTTYPITLDQVVRRTLLHNPELKAKYANFRAKLLKAPQVRSLPDPMLSYTRFVESIQTRTGEQNWIMGISQKFPWFGKLELQGQIACDEATVALMEYRASMLDLRQQSIKDYHRLAFEYAAFGLAQEERGYLVQFVEAATAAYSAGQKGRQAVLKAQTELARVESELLAVPARVSALETDVNRLMGETERKTYYVPDEVPIKTANLGGRDFLGLALCQRPELAGISQMIERSRKAQSLARLDYLPDFTLGANYISIGSRPDHPTGMMKPPDQGEDAWNFTVGINIPLPNARRSAQVNEALEREEEARRLRQAMEDRIQATVAETLARLRSLNERLRVYDDSILPLAQEAFEAAQAEYQAGTGTFLDLLDAERTLLRTRLAYLELVRDYRLGIADLERVTGTSIGISEECAD